MSRGRFKKDGEGREVRRVSGGGGGLRWGLKGSSCNRLRNTDLVTSNGKKDLSETRKRKLKWAIILKIEPSKRTSQPFLFQTLSKQKAFLIDHLADRNADSRYVS